MKENCWITDFYFWNDEVYTEPGYTNTLTLHVISLHTVLSKVPFFFLNRMIKRNPSFVAMQVFPWKPNRIFFLCRGKKCICIIKMAISLGRENSLHAEERKCQTGEQSICYGEGYNYLIRLNITGHWSYSGYFIRYCVQGSYLTPAGNNQELERPVNIDLTHFEGHYFWYRMLKLLALMGWKSELFCCHCLILQNTVTLLTVAFTR